MAKKVKVIMPTVATTVSAKNDETCRRKVAGYARVSTDRLEQETSYEAQLDYYTKFIKSHDNWEFVGMYSDEGITGTNTFKRDGFNRMIDDAMDGKIDLIVIKSVSRFARNTVDALSNVRKLKSVGCEVFFEKENLWSLDPKVEMMLTIMSSLAQEESRSISENTRWGKRKNNADGKVTLSYTQFWGYDKGPDGTMVINEEEAKLVREVFALYLQGYSPYKIAQKFTERGIKTITGKDTWASNTIYSMLKNEKYKGDALLEKSYVKDFLTKERVRNKGEVKQYYVEGDHEPIIEPKVFDMVQEEIKRRGKMGHCSGGYAFSSKVVCGDCGGFYGPKIWHSTDKYRKMVWQCNQKFKNKEKKCGTPTLTEQELKQAVVKAENARLDEKKEAIAAAKELQAMLLDNASLEAEAVGLEAEADALSESIDQAIRSNQMVLQDQAAFQAKEQELRDRYKEKRAACAEVRSRICDRRARADKLDAFIETLGKMKPQTEFTPEYWGALVKKVTVFGKKDIRVEFVDGKEIKVAL